MDERHIRPDVRQNLLVTGICTRHDRFWQDEEHPKAA